jgi:hypothetical protein
MNVGFVTDGHQFADQLPQQQEDQDVNWHNRAGKKNK